MKVTFPYEEKEADIFPRIKRPVAEVYFWSKFIRNWIRYKMIVDSGADYTIIPKYYSADLGIHLLQDCYVKKTYGVGGGTTVFFLKRKWLIKIGEEELRIPLGFLESESVPPLLGREGCLNLFYLLFANYQTEISLDLRLIPKG